MSPYRSDRESWQRTLEEGAQLAMQDAHSFAGRVPTVRRQLERVISVLAMARADAESAPGNVETATLITALESVRATLLGKLALAEAMPDIVLTPPEPPEPEANPDRVVIEPPSRPPPRPPPAPQPSHPPDPYATPRGFQLRLVELTVRNFEVLRATSLVRSHLESPRPLDPGSRAQVEKAHEVLKSAFTSAEKLLREAFLHPDPSTRAIDAELAREWNEIYADVGKLRDVVIAARGVLSR
jgi:hypothetical protein